MKKKFPTARLPGGIWDKLGNRYESLWTVDALLSVLRGEAEAVVVEPHGPDGEGVEFYRDLADGSREYFSAKRQKSGNLWSLADLTRPEVTGRSVFGDLLNRISGGDGTERAVFASQTTPNSLLRLCEGSTRARSGKDLERQIRENADLAGEVEKRLLSGFNLGWDALWEFLRRIRVDGCTEDLLKRQVERLVERDLVMQDGSAVTPAGGRLVLYELVFASFGTPIGREDIITHLSGQGMAPRDWLRPSEDHETLERRNWGYCAEIESELIFDSHIPRSESEKLLDLLAAGVKEVILSGAAGMGKSCILAQCLAGLRNRGVPHLVLRLDSQEGRTSTLAFGKELGFTVSPVAVLSGIARGRPAVLIVDQLDALSTASGRNPRLWELFREILFEVKSFGNIQLLLSCRSFDLEHDSRLRRLAGKENDSAQVKAGLLDVEIVKGVLKEAGSPSATSGNRYIELLRTPLHLSVFLHGDPRCDKPVNNLAQLYDRYWENKRRNARYREPKTVRFEEVVERLANYLSDNQTLSGPLDVFDTDGLAEDAEALASDHVIFIESRERRCRFFHESFFDYTFARLFVGMGKQVTPDLLTPEREQHLFRRSQVRQIFAYLRERDGGFQNYLRQLRELLGSDSVRIHLKKGVLDWLGSLDDPSVEEWKAIRNFIDLPVLGRFVRFVPWNKGEWFLPLERAGTLSEWLGGGSVEVRNFAARLLALPDVMQNHSAAVAEILREHLEDTPDWQELFVGICSFGELHHSREFFDLFLEKFCAGWFDQQSPHDWYCLNKLAQNDPQLAGEFLSEFLQRRFPDCLDETTRTRADSGMQLGAEFFKALKKSPIEPVLEAILPVLTSLLKATTYEGKHGRMLDPLARHFNLNERMNFGDGLAQYLIWALGTLGKESPERVDQLCADMEKLECYSAAFILERVWAVNGEYFGDKAARYLSKDPIRLSVRYHFATGNNRASVTRKLLRRIGPCCSEKAFIELESAILAYNDEWEAKNLEYNGKTQYELLIELPENRLSPAGWHRVDALRRKFGRRTERDPRPIRLYPRESPVSHDAGARMRDRHWLGALAKYSRREYWAPDGPKGGIGEALVDILKRASQREKERFAKLLTELPESTEQRFIEAILEGICSTKLEKDATENYNAGFGKPLNIEEIEKSVMHAHRRGNGVSGRAICSAVRGVSDRTLPETILEVVGHYAQNDPDPKEEVWARKTGKGARMYGSDPHFHGINSGRGAAAETIQIFLYDDPERWWILSEAVESLVQDQSLAVRSCAVGCLLARFSQDHEEAIGLFLRLIQEATGILNTRYVERFIHYAAQANYAAMRDLLVEMLEAEDPQVRKVAGRQIAVAACRDEVAMNDLEKLVLKGAEPIREGAAGVFAHNLNNPEFAKTCRGFLLGLFDDPSEDVRKQAAECWRGLDSDQLVGEVELMERFLESEAFLQGVGGLLVELDSCVDRLPEVVLRIPEILVRHQTDQPNGTIDHAFYNLSQLVMRLYQQSRANSKREDREEFEARCLNVIDLLLSTDRGGMENELRKMER